MSSNREEKIRQRAHAIWEREGRPQGAHDRHWHQAASEVDGEGAPAAEPAATTKPPAKAEASAKQAAPSKAAKTAKPPANAEKTAAAKTEKAVAAKAEKSAAKPRKTAEKG